MKEWREGFTMIELIFVIVIIGILAIIALPKLTATRDDAKISTQIANARICLSDIKATYTANGKISGDSEACKKAMAADTVKVKIEDNDTVTISGAPADTNLSGNYEINASSVSYR